MCQQGKYLMSCEIKLPNLGNQRKRKVTGSLLITAYCPHCRAVTNLSMSIIPNIVTGSDGTTKIATTRTYHCESCGVFVRSGAEESLSL